MELISKLEELWTFDEDFFKDKMSKAKVIKEDLSKLGLDVDVFPCDDPKKGEFGFYVCKKDEKDVEEFADISTQSYHTVTSNDCDSKEFNKAFQEAFVNDQPIVKANSPKDRKLGFIVLKNSESTLYLTELDSYHWRCRDFSTSLDEWLTKCRKHVCLNKIFELKDDSENLRVGHTCHCGESFEITIDEEVTQDSTGFSEEEFATIKKALSDKAGRVALMCSCFDVKKLLD